MSGTIKIIFAAILFAAVFFLTQDKVSNYLEPEQESLTETPGETVTEDIEPTEDLIIIDDDTPFEIELAKDRPENDSLYRWDQQLVNWVKTGEVQKAQAQLASYRPTGNSSSEDPIVVDWNVLMNIKYKLRYFKELDMEMYSPIFGKAVKALHEKEVIIEGYVIPFEAEEELLSLSFNPYAACFFCGKASPASVISMYLKDEGSKTYKIDDFKKFRGTLYLNHDDPNEFYYILRDAQEE